MDKEDWLLKSIEEKSTYLNQILLQLAQVTREDKEHARKGEKRVSIRKKRELENKVYQIIDWEKDNHDL